jgi:hypothetical protein
LVEILDRIVSQPHHWPIGRVTFQKLAYFATEAGMPTRLGYIRGSFGPFAAEVKPLITKLVNNGVIREQRLGSMFSVVPGPTFDDARRAHYDDIRKWEKIIDRVSDLIQRLRTTHQAELAASVHFAARSLANHTNSRPTEIEVLDEVMNWKQHRRPPLERTEVAMAVRSLGALGWITLEASPELPVPDDELLGV